MTVEFESTEEDAVDAVSYLNHNLPQFRNQMRTLRLFSIFMLVFGLFLGLSLLVTFNLVNFICAVFLLGYSAVLWQTQKQRMRGLFQKSVKSGAAATLIGPHSYTVTPEGLASTSQFGRSVLYWSGIEKVVELEKSIAFHFSAAQAILIPKRVFASQAHGAEFLRLVEQYRQQATGQPIPQTTRGAWWTQGQSVVENSQSNRLGGS